MNTVEAKTVTLKTRVPGGLRDMLNKRATANGISTSEYVRQAILEALIANK